MKRVFGLLLASSLLVTACSKKTRPTVSTPVQKTSNTTTVAPPVKDPPPVVVIDSAEEETVPVTSAPAMAPMIVIDEKGSVITAKEKLPADVAAKVNYSRISRGYTPAQRQNLIFRFKMVPPRVLFVPDQLASKTARGTYVIYRKKFWYWKKEDGLFHIDETYYQ